MSYSQMFSPSLSDSSTVSLFRKGALFSLLAPPTSARREKPEVELPLVVEVLTLAW